jgi:hypothetical protein
VTNFFDYALAVAIKIGEVVLGLASIACGFYLILGIRKQKKTLLIPMQALALFTILLAVVSLFGTKSDLNLFMDISAGEINSLVIFFQVHC